MSAERWVRMTGLFLLAGVLLSTSAVRANGQEPPRKGRSLKRHAPPPAVGEGEMSADDPVAIARRWGVEIASLRLASGGYMLEFRYRIVDAVKAQPLFGKGLRPTLRDDATGFESLVPSPPTTGALRSTYDAKAGRTYFMFFANPSRFVKPGSRVRVTIGEFEVTGILVTEDARPVAGDEKAEEKP